MKAFLDLEKLRELVDFALSQGWERADVFVADANNLVLENVKTGERLYCWSAVVTDVVTGERWGKQFGETPKSPSRM